MRYALLCLALMGCTTVRYTSVPLAPHTEARVTSGLIHRDGRCYYRTDRDEVIAFDCSGESMDLPSVPALP